MRVGFFRFAAHPRISCPIGLIRLLGDQGARLGRAVLFGLASRHDEGDIAVVACKLHHQHCKGLKQARGFEFACIDCL
jgi:hypothetical protein